jgi:hypothetical protein
MLAGPFTCHVAGWREIGVWRGCHAVIREAPGLSRWPGRGPDPIDERITLPFQWLGAGAQTNKE